MEKQVEAMVKKASEAPSADEAMKFSQAACNAANAIGSATFQLRDRFDEEGNDADEAATALFQPKVLEPDQSPQP